MLFNREDMVDHPYVVVAEDEAIIGFDLCHTVEEAGCEVQGPLPDLASATRACQERRPDLAILDINLGDEEVFPLADKLLADDVKIIFHSGRYATEDIRQRYPDTIMVQKPCPPSLLLETVQRVLDTEMA